MNVGIKHTVVVAPVLADKTSSLKSNVNVGKQKKGMSRETVQFLVEPSASAAFTDKYFERKGANANIAWPTIVPVSINYG